MCLGDLAPSKASLTGLGATVSANTLSYDVPKISLHIRNYASNESKSMPITLRSTLAARCFVNPYFSHAKVLRAAARSLLHVLLRHASATALRYLQAQPRPVLRREFCGIEVFLRGSRSTITEQVT